MYHNQNVKYGFYSEKCRQTYSIHHNQLIIFNYLKTILDNLYLLLRFDFLLISRVYFFCVIIVINTLYFKYTKIFLF